MVLAKLPWGIILTALGVVFTAIPVVKDWFATDKDGQAALCHLSYDDVGFLEYRCLAVAQAIASDASGPVQPPAKGDRGLAPALEAYIARPAPEAWSRLKNQALRLLDASEALIGEVNRNGGLLMVAYPGKKADDIALLAKALASIRGSIAFLERDIRRPTDLDVPAAKVLLDQLKGLPELADRALKASKEVAAQRAAAKCPT
jgi:hypothetical protein